MDEILRQLGELVLGSVPTMILFVLLVAAYSALVRRPLDKILAERHARTTGAIEQARGALSAAEAETTVYEDKLRGAKAEIFAERDRRLKQWNDEREAALAELRHSSESRIAAAKQEIAAGTAAARAQIESSSEELTARILRAVLPGGAAQGVAQ
jgi:F-type H+-transporting ATPase subunit b